MFKVRNLTVKYGEREVISSQSFEIKKGRITAVIGRNGSGKSTLLSALAGVAAYAGDIVLDGFELRDIPHKSRARMLSFLPQIMPSPQFFVRELVAFGRSPYTGLAGRMGEDDRRAVESAMERVGISHLADNRADRISGGELRLVYLAMILAQSTDTLLLDEPAAFMDIPHGRELCRLLGELRDEGKTVAVVMHDLSLAVECADDIILVSEGRIAFSGTKTECLDARAIETAFDVTRHTDGEKVWFA